MRVESIKQVRCLGMRPVGDITVDTDEHLFIANGVVVSNCKAHAICYSAISTVEMWLKTNYRVEFMTALINNTKLGKKKHGSEDMLVDYVNYARRKDIVVLGPDVNHSKEEFTIENGAIRFSIGHVKNVAGSAKTIIDHAPYAGIQDFYDRVKTETEGKSGKKLVRRVNKKVVESLIAAGAFDWASGGLTVAEKRNELMAEYHRIRKEKEVPEARDDGKWDELEKEMAGLCFSRQPLCEQYKELLDDKHKVGWRRISELDERKKVMAFGQVENITPARSKSGNQRYDVILTDGVDTIRFMVFTAAMQYFKDNCKIGYVAGIPLDRFDDGGNRFFDDRGCIEVVAKQRPPPTTDRTLVKFEDGTRVFRTKGAKDEWLVEMDCGLMGLGRISGASVLLDVLKSLGDRHVEVGRKGLFLDLVEMQKRTGKYDKMDGEVLSMIKEMAQKYISEELEVEKLLCFVYGVMMGQEHRKNSESGSKVQLVGAYHVLMLGEESGAVSTMFGVGSNETIKKEYKDIMGSLKKEEV